MIILLKEVSLQVVSYKSHVQITKNNQIVLRVEDYTFIPFDPANIDYQEYLKWLEEGNEPEPADEE